MLLRLRKIERQPSSREGKDRHPRLKNRDSEARLQRRRITHSERMAVETEEQREARLQRMSANQSDRLAAETEEQREAKLQRMCANQSERLAAETNCCTICDRKFMVTNFVNVNSSQQPT